MFAKRLLIAMLVIFSMILGACAPQAAASPSPVAPGEETVVREMAPYIIAAMDALALQLGIERSEVHYVSAEEVEWNDSCLELGGPAESCLQALTPGQRVILEVGDAQYEVHTDETGSVVRVKP